MADQTHHPNKKKNNIKSGVLNDMRNIQEFAGQQYPDSCKSKGDAERPIEKRAADDEKKDGGGKYLFPRESDFGERESTAENNYGEQKRRF